MNVRIPRTAGPCGNGPTGGSHAVERYVSRGVGGVFGGVLGRGKGHIMTHKKGLDIASSPLWLLTSH